MAGGRVECIELSDSEDEIAPLAQRIGLRQPGGGGAPPPPLSQVPSSANRPRPPARSAANAKRPARAPAHATQRGTHKRRRGGRIAASDTDEADESDESDESEAEGPARAGARGRASSSCAASSRAPPPVAEVPAMNEPAAAAPAPAAVAPPAAAPAAAEAPDAAAATSAYLKARAADLRKRSFPLGTIAPGVVPCARTVKTMSSWGGLWPPIREFLQNTIDHLQLLKNGALHPALVLERTEDEDGAAVITFRCRGAPGPIVCAIRVASADELVITQHYTFPLHPRALDTGVHDTTKGGGSGSAGGFGDGFKTAMVALLALPGGACRELRWTFDAEGRRIEWLFRGGPCPACRSACCPACCPASRPLSTPSHAQHT